MSVSTVSASHGDRGVIIADWSDCAESRGCIVTVTVTVNGLVKL